MIHLIPFVLGFAWADLPVEPVTYPKNVEFKQGLSSEDEVSAAKPLIVTNVQFDHVDVTLPDLRVLDAENGFDRAINRLVKTAVDAIPRASLTLRAVVDRPVALDGPTGRRRVIGGVVTKILSRSGLAPARDVPEGARVSHVSIDRLGFELRWTNDFPAGRPQVHHAITHVDSRQVAVVAGRDRVDLDLKLGKNARAALVTALRRTLGDDDPARLDPRLYVHLLDLNKNNFGAFPLATRLNEELIREALDRPRGLPNPCAGWLGLKF